MFRKVQRKCISLVRPLIFQLEPELAHNLAIATVKLIARSPTLQHWLSSQLAVSDPLLEQQLWGLEFPNPLGLSAGFDKNAEGLGAWHCLGFGFAEVGTITAYPQEGNPQPRLFRLVADQAILNRMGFNNHGAEAIARRMENYLKHSPVSIPIGINLGKSRITPLEQSAEDYLASFQRLRHLGDYFVINVSSPNTLGLRSLQTAAQLTAIVKALQQANHAGKPLLVKIAPDLTFAEIDQVLGVCTAQGINGIIATNTTTSREGLSTTKYQAGGISGQPLEKRSTEIVRYIYRVTQGNLPIIGVGGIDSPESAWQKISAGASLLQVYTGLVYHGWGLTRRILQGIADKVRSLGLQNIREAVGCGLPFS
jgi:dihydroorotate dehydrogenase